MQFLNRNISVLCTSFVIVILSGMASAQQGSYDEKNISLENIETNIPGYTEELERNTLKIRVENSATKKCRELGGILDRNSVKFNFWTGGRTPGGKGKQNPKKYWFIAKEIRAKCKIKSTNPKDDNFWSGENNDAFNVAKDDTTDFWSGGGKEAKDFWSGDGGMEEEILVEKSIAKASGHQYLGAKHTSGSYVTVRYRDHGEIDGDRVRIFRNGLIVEGNATLRNGYISKRISISKGTNRISFEALNAGTKGSNTAEFQILDTTGVEIYSHEWSIKTGFKATLLVVRK